MKIWIAVFLILAVIFLFRSRRRGACTREVPETAPLITPEIKETEPEPELESLAVETPQIDYSKTYQAKYLLTKHEWIEYQKLKNFAAAKGLQVCPKVRLADIVEPRWGERRKIIFNKIKAKHVDFVITDSNLYIKAIIELDDNSHNLPERQKRDEFVDQVLTSVGYRVIHTRVITEETLIGL